MTGGGGSVSLLGAFVSAISLSVPAVLLVQHLSILPRVLVTRGKTDGCDGETEKGKDAGHGGVGVLWKERAS
jgi:hypothetical protein